MKIEVKDSKIGGKGVFAIEDIKNGEVILSWNPKVILKDDLAKLSDDELNYIVKKDEEAYFQMQEPEKFVNHSCNPNSAVVGDSDVAIRDIKRGEEITSDYGIECSMLSFECNCGSKNCRHQIQGILR